MENVYITFAANLFRKQCAKFNQNGPSFVGVITKKIIISVFFFWAQCIMSANFRLQVTFGQNWPTQQSHGLVATAKLFVILAMSCTTGWRSAKEERLSLLVVLVVGVCDWLTADALTLNLGRLNWPSAECFGVCTGLFEGAVHDIKAMCRKWCTYYRLRRWLHHTLISFVRHVQA